MIKITATLDGNADLTKFAHNLKANILRSQTKIAQKATESAKLQVEANAPEWRGTLKNRVAMKVFPKNHRGEVFMVSPLFNMIAMQNEFNIRGKRKLYKSAYPKLAEWAMEKGVFTNQPYVVVGGRGTRLGKMNRFFLPAFMDVQAKVPDIASFAIVEALQKTRG